MAEIKRCKTPFATEVGGAVRMVAAGELVSTDDPVYTKDTAELFEALDVHVEDQRKHRARASGVEQTTAEPGEKRTVTKPPRRTTSQAKAATEVTDEETKA